MGKFRIGDNVLLQDKVVWGTKGCTAVSTKKLVTVHSYSGGDRYIVRHETTTGIVLLRCLEDEMQLVTFEDDPEVFI